MKSDESFFLKTASAVVWSESEDGSVLIPDHDDLYGSTNNEDEV